MSYAIYERSKHVSTFDGVLTNANGMIYASPILEVDTLFFDTSEEAINYVFSYRQMVYQQNSARLKLIVHDVIRVNPKVEFCLRISQKVKYYQNPKEFIDEVVHTVG